MTSRRRFISTLAGAALAPAQTPRRPNVVVIYTDDQGIGDLGCYGANEVQTPHIDALARSGARFTDWYSNCPVCSPSRASLLTGKYPQRTGITNVLTSVASFDTPGLRRGEVTLGGELRKLGYRSAAIGKWHLGSAAQSRPLQQGFDQFYGFYSGWTDGFSHRYYVQSGKPQQIFHDLWENGEEAWADPEHHVELFSRKAKEYIGEAKGRAVLSLPGLWGAALPHDRAAQVSGPLPREHGSRPPHARRHGRHGGRRGRHGAGRVARPQARPRHAGVFPKRQRRHARNTSRSRRTAIQRRQQSPVPGLQGRALRGRHPHAGADELAGAHPCRAGGSRRWRSYGHSADRAGLGWRTGAGRYRRPEPGIHDPGWRPIPA